MWDLGEHRETGHHLSRSPCTGPQLEKLAGKPNVFVLSFIKIFPTYRRLFEPPRSTATERCGSSRCIAARLRITNSAKTKCL